MFYAKLAVSLRKKDDICVENIPDISFYRNMVKDYTNYDIIEKQIKNRLSKTMTYIISGKLNNKPFLMVDCVATNKNGEYKTYHFRNKLNKLITTEIDTFFCFTGIDAYQHAINAFDEKCHIHNKNFDFKNINHINEILEIIDYLIKRNEYNNNRTIFLDCRMYFINKNGVYYYNINRDGNLSEMFEIPNNRYIEPEDFMNTPIKFKKVIKNNDELINFSKDRILKVQDYGIDMKNKFSYALYDENNLILENSIKNNKELVLSMVCGKYNELE